MHALPCQYFIIFIIFSKFWDTYPERCDVLIFIRKHIFLLPSSVMQQPTLKPQSGVSRKKMKMLPLEWHQLQAAQQDWLNMCSSYEVQLRNYYIKVRRL